MLGHSKLPQTGFANDKETPGRPETPRRKLEGVKTGSDITHTKKKLFRPPTLTPSILKPRVAVELMVSLHCMYLGLVTTFCRFSSGVGASGSTSIIFWYMSGLGEGFFLALVSSSSR